MEVSVTGTILGEERGDATEAFGVIVLDPGLFLGGEEVWKDEGTLDGDPGDVLEAKVGFTTVTETGRGRGLLDEEDGFDTDAKGTILIVTGFIGDAHTGLKGDLVEGGTESDALGTLVDIEVGAYAVACTMTVIQSIPPEGSASQDVEGVTGGTWGEDGTIQGDMTLEDTGEAGTFTERGSTKMKGTSDVGGPIEILTTRVTEVDGVLGDGGAMTLYGFVVDDGGVGTDTGDGIEAEALKVILTGPTGFEMIGAIDLVQGDALGELGA